MASNASSRLHSRIIDKIEVVRSGRVRRAKLYYIRELRGKSARIKEVHETKETRKADCPLENSKGIHEPTV